MSRTPRELVLAPALAEALGSCGDCALNLHQLESVEAAWAISFEDDVLALFAHRAEPLSSINLATVVARTGELAELGVRGDLIGLGALNDEQLLCIELRRQKKGASELVIGNRHGSFAGERVALIELVIRLFGAPSRAKGIFRAALFRPAPESTSCGARVVHKIFGEGRALSEVGKGPTRKIKVDFSGQGLKTLQARFLRWLED